MLPGILGIGGFVGGAGFTVDYLSVATIEDTNQVTHTFSSQGFGVAQTTREIYVLISYGGSAARTISSATIGGVSATIRTQDVLSDGSQAVGSAIISAAVPTGTTGTIAITFSTFGIYAVAIGIVRVINKTTNVASNTTSASDASPPASLTSSPVVNSNGAVLASWTCSDEPFGVTWTNLTEQYDSSTAAASSFARFQYSGAVSSGLSASGAYAITPSQNASGASGVSLSYVSIA